MSEPFVRLMSRVKELCASNEAQISQLVGKFHLATPERCEFFLSLQDATLKVALETTLNEGNEGVCLCMCVVCVLPRHL